MMITVCCDAGCWQSLIIPRDDGERCGCFQPLCVFQYPDDVSYIRGDRACSNGGGFMRSKTSALNVFTKKFSKRAWSILNFEISPFNFVYL